MRILNGAICVALLGCAGPPADDGPAPAPAPEATTTTAPVPTPTVSGDVIAAAEAFRVGVE
ncbi:MAG: hypothetical protein QF689_12245, partial [Candidatus Latescibacteria bacterium]|nr:hypothetical protein [Candidatus Latescibacterota bacterium]